MFKVLSLTTSFGSGPDNNKQELECPTFVSPYWHDSSICKDCNALIEPLIYQVGVETRTQHDVTKPHDTLSLTNNWKGFIPGIFVSKRIDKPSGFIATAQCYNQLWHSELGAAYQVGQGVYAYESIMLTDIQAYCYRCVTPVTKGILLGDTSNILIPVHERCTFGVDNVSKSQWTFSKQGPYISFSRPLAADLLNQPRNKPYEAILGGQYFS